MKFKKNKAFTLIELLVVVGIISILAAVVISSINTARKKGSDSGIKSNLNTIRNQAELWYSDRGTYFTVKHMVDNSWSSCVGAYSLGNTLFGDSVISKAISDMDSLNGNSSVSCVIFEKADGSSTFSINVGLASGGTLCLDNTGYLGKNGSFTSGGTTGCNP